MHCSLGMLLISFTHLTNERFDPIKPALKKAFFDAFSQGYHPCVVEQAIAEAIRATVDQLRPTLDRTPWLVNEDGYFNKTFDNETLL